MRNDLIIIGLAFFAVFVFPVPAMISAASTVMVLLGIGIVLLGGYAAWTSGMKIFKKFLNNDVDNNGENG